MAFDYDSGTGFFDKLGPLVSAVLDVETWQTTWAASIAGAITPLEELAYEQQARTKLYSQKDSHDSALNSAKSSLKDILQSLLQQEMYTGEGFYSSNLTDLLNQLIFCMNRDTETVLQSTVTITSPAAGTPAPTGDFSVVASKYAPKTTAADASSQVDGSIWPNSYKVVCTQRGSSGAEQFQVRGQLPVGGVTSPIWYNAGNAGTLALISSISNTKLANGGFESGGTSAVFDNWTLVTGAWTTDLLKETSSVYRGSQAMKMKCTVTGGKIKQVLTGVLQPYKKYLISFKAKKSVSADGTLKVGFTGTTGCFSSLTVSSGLTTSYAHYTTIFNTGADPSLVTDFIIELSSATATSDYVLIDEVCLTEMKAFKGTYIAVVGGSTDPQLDDHWTVPVANNFAGKFLTFFGRFFNVLLPAAGSPSIADALVT